MSDPDLKQEIVEKVVCLDDYRPVITFNFPKRIEIIPVRVFEDIVDMKLDPSVLADDVLRSIIDEWLSNHLN